MCNVPEDTGNYRPFTGMKAYEPAASSLGYHAHEAIVPYTRADPVMSNYRA